MLLLVACGGSLADADRPGPARSARTPPGDFCAAVQAGVAAARPLAALVERGDAVPREQIVEAAEQVRSANADVLATAPEEIRADVERSIAEADVQLDALEAAGGDAAAMARVGATTSGSAEQEYAVAARRVREYVGVHCRIDADRRPSR
jgi:hypothetical protein